MKHPQLSPLEQLAEDLTPSTVSYKIRVIWPDGQPSIFQTATTLTLEETANRLEILVTELRVAAQEQR
jgi:hypothetical protein